LRTRHQAPVISLTDREREILSLLAEGLVKKEIAKRLGIAYGTVDTHVSRLYAKLNVANAPAAVSRGYERGLLSPLVGPGR
jgi:DNA-binding CsgD family transcriptional regulator